MDGDTHELMESALTLFSIKIGFHHKSKGKRVDQSTLTFDRDKYYHTKAFDHSQRGSFKSLFLHALNLNWFT